MLSTIIISALLILYVGLHAALLWWCASKLCTYLTLRQPTWRTVLQFLVWTIAFWLFFLWYTSAMFWPFFRIEGYYLASPLLPLAHYTPLLAVLRVVGSNGMLFLLILWQGMLGLFVTRASLKIFLGFMFLTISWLVATALLQHTEPQPHWLSRIGYIPRSIAQEMSLSHAAKKMSAYMTAVVQADPVIDIIVIPEDGFQSTQLSSDNIKALVMPNIGQRQLLLLVGAYRNSGNEQFNTLYWLQGGNNHTYFDKRHTMIFTERTPPIFGIPFMQHLDTDKIPLSAGHNPRPMWHLAPDLLAVPYLCSELFFNNQPDDKYPNAIIFAFCSDKWACASYIKNIMYLVARLRALEWQRDILYLNYGKAAYVTKNGDTYPLKDFSPALHNVDARLESENIERRAHDLDPAALSALAEDQTPYLGTITGEHSMSLLLPQQSEYFGFTFSINHRLASQDEPIEILIKQEEHSEEEKIIRAYLASGSNFYYLDSMKVDNATTHLRITMEPSGVVYIEDPKHQQIIIASPYR